MSRPRRKLARPGDVISWSARDGVRRGTVTKKMSEYLTVRLDEPRVLDDWERMYPAYSDPMEDHVYYHSDYTIEAYAEDGKEVQQG